MGVLRGLCTALREMLLLLVQLLDDDEPAPLSHGLVLAEVPLGNLDQLPLVPLLNIHPCADPLQHFTLDLPHPFDHKLVPKLLEEGQGSSPEEDQSVAEPVALTSEA